MRNRRIWLIAKAFLILLFTFIIFGMPTTDTFRKWLRFAMLTLFVVSFIKDLISYKQSND